MQQLKYLYQDKGLLNQCLHNRKQMLMHEEVCKIRKLNQIRIAFMVVINENIISLFYWKTTKMEHIFINEFTIEIILIFLDKNIFKMNFYCTKIKFIIENFKIIVKSVFLFKSIRIKFTSWCIKFNICNQYVWFLQHQF